MSEIVVTEPRSKRHNRDMEDNTALNESITTMITDIQRKEDPSIKDLVNLFTGYIKIQIEKEEIRAKAFERRLTYVEEEIENHQAALHDLQETTYSLQLTSTTNTSDLFKCETSLHKIEQLKIENDLFFSQIPFKPDAEQLTAKILEATNIPKQSAANSYTFLLRAKHSANSTINSNATNHALVLTFTNTKEKAKFFQERKKLGPLKVSQLIPNCPEAIADKSIKIINRLTTFNLKVVKALGKKKSIGDINNFQMHNGLFRYKLTETDSWIYVGTQQQLNDLAVGDDSMKQGN